GRGVPRIETDVETEVRLPLALEPLEARLVPCARRVGDLDTRERGLRGRGCLSERGLRRRGVKLLEGVPRVITGNARSDERERGLADLGDVVDVGVAVERLRARDADVLVVERRLLRVVAGIEGALAGPLDALSLQCGISVDRPEILRRDAVDIELVVAVRRECDGALVDHDLCPLRELGRRAE